jgi:branched-chain amino acid aminotransferase
MRSKNDKFVYRDGSDEVGPICSKLLSTLKGIQQGKIKDAFGWLDTIEKPKDYLHRGQQNGTNGVQADKTVDEMP